MNMNIEATIVFFSIFNMQPRSSAESIRMFRDRCLEEVEKKRAWKVHFDPKGLDVDEQTPLFKQLVLWIQRTFPSWNKSMVCFTQPTSPLHFGYQKWWILLLDLFFWEIYEIYVLLAGVWRILKTCSQLLMTREIDVEYEE